MLASTEGKGGCRIYRDDRIGLLTADAFTSAREVVIEPGDEAALVVGHVDGELRRGVDRAAQRPAAAGVLARPRRDRGLRARRRRRTAARAASCSTATPITTRSRSATTCTTFELGADAPKPTCEASDVEYTLEFDDSAGGAGVPAARRAAPRRRRLPRGRVVHGRGRHHAARRNACASRTGRSHSRKTTRLP